MTSRKVLVLPGDNIGQLFNNVGYLTSVAFGDLTSFEADI